MATNREKILKTNLYDFLLSINNPYENACIIENITGENIYDENEYRCWQTAYPKDCAECVERFLNKEV